MDQNEFPHPWSETAWMDWLLSTNEIFFLLLFENKGLCGFILANLSGADSFAHLLKIVVTKDKKRQGYGKELLFRLEEKMKKGSIKTLFLEVEENNAGAVAFYRQRGFKEIHYKKSFYASGANAFIMTLDV